ncbi:MAG: hypothetical protein OEV40_20485 [Acidimicrobiia bacterium]|nr:hypothetical protein [Acidimicrobiia bacterium]
MTEPRNHVVGLMVDSAPPTRFSPFLGALARWCRPRVLPDARDAVAWIATSPRVADPRRRPAAVWVSSLHDWDANKPAVESAHVLLTDDREVLARAGDRGVWVGDGVDVRGTVPLTPFVRSRWRARTGLPGDLVIHVGPPPTRVGGGGAGTGDAGIQSAEAHEAIADELVPTGLAVAAAVVATGPTLAAALAWGAPTVTDAASAAAIGAIDGEHVLVASPDEMHDVATRLANDHARGGMLGRQGRRLVEQTHDVVDAAALTAQRLGLRDEAAPAPLDVLSVRLAELWVTDDAAIVERVGASLGLSHGDLA